MVFDGDLPTGDFHPISSYPCWAYTRPSTATAFTFRLRLHYKAARVGYVSRLEATLSLREAF